MNSKSIKILYNGPIYAKNGVYGPIETPYTESLSTIFTMIVNGIKVVEVLPNGQEVVLTVNNFDKVNMPDEPKQNKETDDNGDKADDGEAGEGTDKVDPVEQKQPEGTNVPPVNSEEGMSADGADKAELVEEGKASEGTDNVEHTEEGKEADVPPTNVTSEETDNKADTQATVTPVVETVKGNNQQRNLGPKRHN